MSKRNFPRVLCVGALLISLGACASYSAPSAPKAKQVQKFENGLKNAFDGKAESDTSSTQAGPITSTEIIDGGYAYADYRCQRFFGALQGDRNKWDFANSEMAAATAASGAITAFTRASAIVTSLVTAGLGVGSATTGNYGDDILLKKYNQQIYGLVMKAQTAYKGTIKTDYSDFSMLSKEQAYDIVIQYASLCSYASIDQLASDAIAKAAPQAASNPGGTPKITLQ